MNRAFPSPGNVLHGITETLQDIESIKVMSRIIRLRHGGVLVRATGFVEKLSFRV